MKLLTIVLLLLLAGTAYSQSTYYIRADSTRLQKVGGNNELILENGTRTRTGAYLKNNLNGRTVFSYAGDSLSISGSNLTLWRGAGTQNVTVGIPGGVGGFNSNIGSGYRWAIPGTNNIKTNFPGYGLLIDSSSNANALTHTLDTAVVFPAVRATVPAPTLQQVFDAEVGGSVLTKFDTILTNDQALWILGDKAGGGENRIFIEDQKLVLDSTYLNQTFYTTAIGNYTTDFTPWSTVYRHFGMYAAGCTTCGLNTMETQWIQNSRWPLGVDTIINHMGAHNGLGDHHFYLADLTDTWSNSNRYITIEHNGVDFFGAYNNPNGNQHQITIGGTSNLPTISADGTYAASWLFSVFGKAFIEDTIWSIGNVRFSGLPTGPGTKAVRIDANGNLSTADTTVSGGTVTDVTATLPITSSGGVTPDISTSMATGSLIYRKTAGTGVMEVNTLATLKTDLGLTGTNSGDQTIAVTGTTTGITTLSGSGGSMTIAGAGINTVGVSGSTITITGTEVDGSVTNELQTWQQTLTTGSTLTGNNTIAGGGNDFIFDNNNTFTINSVFGATSSTIVSAPSYVFLQGVNTGLGKESNIDVVADTIYIRPNTGGLIIDTLTNLSTQNTLLGWQQGSGQGKVGYITLGSGLSLSSGVLSATGTGGTVTSVGFTGGLISVATATTTPAFTVAGTSGGIPYFSSTSTWASSAALAANAIVIGGGAGVAPATTTTAAGILTWIGTPSSANLAAAVTGETGSGALVFGTSPDFTTGATIGSVAIPTISSTNTLTNKRITQRVGTTASSATPTPDGDANDVYTVTALAEGATFAAPTGTPVNGQGLIIRILDNGTARTLAWNAIYRASSDLALPTTTVISKTMYLKFIYNDAATKWDFVAFLNNF